MLWVFADKLRLYPVLLLMQTPATNTLLAGI